MTEATRTAISRLAKASSLEGLPAKAGEPLNVCAYSDAKQRLYFFGQDVQQRVETLHYLTLSDLEQGVGAVRIGRAAGEDPQDRFYGGTRVTNLSFNSTGDRLLLSGPPSESIPYLGVVDLRNDDDSAPPTSSSSSSKKVVVRAPHRQLLPLEMRGRLLKAAWHPLSKTHVVALIGPEHGPESGQVAELRLYDLSQEDRTRMPELVIPVDGDVASFCFGPESLWQRFTIYLLSTGIEGTGAPPRLSALCPVVPYRAQVPAMAVKELQEAVLEELALDKVARRREELEAQWAFLVRCFGDVVELAKERGDKFLAFRWVTSRVAMASDRMPVLQEVEYPNPPVATAGGVSIFARALDLLNPSGTLPALAVTYDKEQVDVLLAVSLVEPLLETPGGHELASHRWRALETRRLARLKVGHRAGEALPRLLLDPERHLHGTLYVVREQVVLRLVLPWIRRIEELGEGGDDAGAFNDGGMLGRRPPGKTRMREVHRIGAGRGGGGKASAGACMVYNASVGSLLMVRRRDAEVEMLNLAILPFMVDEEEEGEEEEEEESEQGRGEGGGGDRRTSTQQQQQQKNKTNKDGRFSNFVPFETACQPDMERLRRGYERFLQATPGPSGNELAQLKQDLIQEVVIPLRALQTRMVVRADEVAVLFERAHAAAKALDSRLGEQRAACGRLQNHVADAEEQLEKDELVAQMAAQQLHWVRTVITPQENRKFQEVQLAEARLRNLDERLGAVEEWTRVQAKEQEEAGGGGAEGGEKSRRAVEREHEEARRRLAREVEELMKDVAHLEGALSLDEEDVLEERGGGGVLLLGELETLRIN